MLSQTTGYHRGKKHVRVEKMYEESANITTGLDAYVSQATIPLHNQQENDFYLSWLRDEIISMSN